MAGYRYRGTDFDAHLPFTDPPPAAPLPGINARCGTRAGYRAHRLEKETACDDCKAANSAYTVEYAQRRKMRKIKTGFTRDKCGTYSGYSAHRRYAVPMCGPCKEAGAQYSRERRAKASA